MCERELDNAYDKYAVAVNNEQGKVVGHVPIELSKVFALVWMRAEDWSEVKRKLWKPDEEA